MTASRIFSGLSDGRIRHKAMVERAICGQEFHCYSSISTLTVLNSPEKVHQPHLHHIPSSPLQLHRLHLLRSTAFDCSSPLPLFTYNHSSLTVNPCSNCDEISSAMFISSLLCICYLHKASHAELSRAVAISFISCHHSRWSNDQAQCQSQKKVEGSYSIQRQKI